MCDLKTICNIQSILIFQNFFCVNRSYALHNKRDKIICYIIFTICFVTVSIVATCDLVRILSINIFQVIIQFAIGFEALYITCISQFHTNVFNAVTRLDEKCDYSDEYFTEIRYQARKLTVIIVVSILLDVVGMIFVGLSPSAILMMTMAFSSHDSEMGLFSLLINGFNLRLASLYNVRPSYGARVYRHVIASASYLKEEFNIRILIMIAMTIFTSITYAVIIFLVGDKMVITIYLSWRELRSLYSLWRLCAAAANTEKVCNRLVLHLAKRLVFDFEINDKTLAQSITNRWYISAKTHRPQYVNTTTFSINLTVPLKILDWVCNYLLIILQVYVFYKDQ